MMLHSGAPDGYLVDDLIVWEDLGAHGTVAKGFRVETFDLRAAAEGLQEEVRNRLVAVYRGLPRGFRLQHRYRPRICAETMLAEYERMTELSPFPAIRARRTAHARRFRALHGGNQLRSEEVTLYFVAECNNFLPGGGGSPEQARRLLRQVAADFARMADVFGRTFDGLAVLRPLNDESHFRALEHTIDPSVDLVASTRTRQPERSVCEQLMSSGIAGNRPHGIHLNGYYQAILTLETQPIESHAGLYHGLSRLPFNTYEVVINAGVQDAEAVIRQKERLVATLTRENRAAELRGDASASKAESARLEEEQIRRLYRGQEKLLAATFMVRIWAETEPELTLRVALARRAIDGMPGAVARLATLGTTTRKLFFAGWPGWTGGFDRRELTLADTDLADLVPFTGTFEGHGAGAEILLDGVGDRLAPRPLVGLSTFLGTPATAQHTLVVGPSGAGKTTLLSDLAFQSSPYYAFECLLEEGCEYTPYARAHGCETIRIQTDGVQCINYLDTGGLPLSPAHLAFASSLGLHMAGGSRDGRRKAILTQYLRVLYGHAAERWLRAHPGEAEAVAREALAVQRRQQDRPEENLTDAWLALRAQPDQGDVLARLTEDEVFRFAHEPATRGACEAHAFTRFQPAEFPQHAQLVELLLTHRLPEFAGSDLDEVAALLRNWTAGEGEYGPLFDGASNVALDARVVHFELGRIPEEQKELKAAVALLLTGRIRQRIIQLPREQRKRVVIEEMMRWLDVPGADHLIVEFCAQMRKYRCVVWMVVQQFAKLLEAGIAPYVVGNCRQFLILKMLDRQDLNALAERLPGGLPEPLRDAVLQFPTPENLPVHDRYSSFAYYNPNLQPPLAGIARLYLPEVA